MAAVQMHVLIITGVRIKNALLEKEFHIVICVRMIVKRGY